MAKERKTGRAQVVLRVSEDMRRRLENAAKSNDCSINAEILERLKRSFELEERLGGPQVVELIEMIGTVMKSTGAHAGFTESGKLTNQGEWLALPYAFDQATKAANAILEHYRPPGKIVVPKPNLVEVIGVRVRGTKVDLKEEAARLSQSWAVMGPAMAAYELSKKETKK